jgi:hypothetical protein
MHPSNLGDNGQSLAERFRQLESMLVRGNLSTIWVAFCRTYFYFSI